MTGAYHTNSSTYLCGKHADEGCSLDSFVAYEVILVVIVSLVFSFHHIVTSSLTNIAKSCLIRKRASPELLQLGNEVKRLKAELATISPTSEFSAYFKTERLLKKAVEKYDAAAAEEKKEQPSEVKVEMAMRFFFQASGILLLHSVSGIYAFCIPSIAFWPFNVLLRFPSVWSAQHCGESELMLAPVSMFVFVYCVIFTARKLCSCI